MAIYKVSFFKPTEAWYSLSPDERKKLVDDSTGIAERCGAKTIIALDTEWTTEEWAWTSVTKFPNMEAVRKQRLLSYEILTTRYIESRSYLGTQAKERASTLGKGT